MKPVPDPYRVLGLTPGASADEVRRAYRRLAKRYHPDSAGDDATARFLAVQSAYESLVSASPRPPGARRAPSRPAPGTRPGPGPAAGAGHRSAGSAAGRGAAGPSTGPAATGDGRTHGPSPRSVRKARLGSTSYDDAEARDPQWQGATWYGQASGTYWTINPKEYADPRKHGPEYQARGRRSSAADARSGPEAPPAPGTAAETTVEEDRWAPGATATPRATAGSGAAATPGATAAEGAAASWAWRTGPPSDRATDDMAASAGAGTAAATGTSTSSAAAGPTWTVGGGSGSAPPARDSDRAADRDRVADRAGAADRGASAWRMPLPGRVVAALIAWPVIGLAAAGLAGQLTGCARYSASCAPGADLLPVLLQPLIVAALLLLPRVAEAAAVGTIAVVLAAVPAAILLSATGGSRAPAGEAPAALVAILGLAWTIGVVAAVAGRARIPGVSRRR